MTPVALELRVDRACAAEQAIEAAGRPRIRKFETAGQSGV